MKSVLLECDSFDVNKLYDWICHNEFNVELNILVKSNNINNVTAKLKELKNVKCVTYAEMFSFTVSQEISVDLYYDQISNYTNDPMFYSLLDRDGYFPTYGIGIQHALTYYRQVALNALSFLYEGKIDLVYFRNTPHHSIEWLLAKSADALDIPVYVTERHVLPWMYSISKGYQLNREKVTLDNLTSDEVDRIKIQIDRFIKENRSEYTKALPSYEKNRMGKGAFKYYNPFKQFLKQFKRPHKFINQLVVYNQLRKHIEKVSLNSKYVVFFLHYQPERTTLPEGYGFHDQLYAIQLLRMALDERITLLIKEHPSMFTNQCEPKARNAKFYKWISKLPNVKMVSLDEDTFALIDNSLFVSTITGTVGLQAYIRKKPVVYFGRSNLVVKGVHHFSTPGKLKTFIDRVCEEIEIVEDVHDNLINLCSNNCVSGIPTDMSIEEIDYHYVKDFQQSAHFKILSEILSKINEV